MSQTAINKVNNLINVISGRIPDTEGNREQLENLKRNYYDGSVFIGKELYDQKADINRYANKKSEKNQEKDKDISKLTSREISTERVNHLESKNLPNKNHNPKPEKRQQKNFSKNNPKTSERQGQKRQSMSLGELSGRTSFNKIKMTPRLDGKSKHQKKKNADL